MEARYDEANKERDAEWEKENLKRWDRALQKENDSLALETLSGDELSDYFNTTED